MQSQAHMDYKSVLNETVNEWQEKGKKSFFFGQITKMILKTESNLSWTSSTVLILCLHFIIFLIN